MDWFFCLLFVRGTKVGLFLQNPTVTVDWILFERPVIVANVNNGTLRFPFSPVLVNDVINVRLCCARC